MDVKDKDAWLVFQRDSCVFEIQIYGGSYGAFWINMALSEEQRIHNIRHPDDILVVRQIAEWICSHHREWQLFDGADF